MELHTQTTTGSFQTLELSVFKPTPENAKAVKLLMITQFSFLLIGVGHLIFGVADLAAGYAGYRLDGQGLLYPLYSYVWAGFLPAAANGALLLSFRHSTKRTTTITRKSNALVLISGVATSVLHLVDFSFVDISVLNLRSHLINHDEFDRNFKVAAADATAKVSTSPSSADFVYVIQSPWTAESGRLVIVLTLIALDIWQLAIAAFVRVQLADESKLSVIENSSDPRQCAGTDSETARHPQRSGLQNNLREIDYAAFADVSVVLIVTAAGTMVYAAVNLASACIANRLSSVVDAISIISAATCVLFSLPKIGAIQGAMLGAHIGRSHSQNLAITAAMSIFIHFLNLCAAIWIAVDYGAVGPTFYRKVASPISSAHTDHAALSVGNDGNVMVASPLAARMIAAVVLLMLDAIEIYGLGRLKAYLKYVDTADDQILVIGVGVYRSG